MLFSFELYDLENGDFRNFKVVEEIPENLYFEENVNCYVKYNDVDFECRVYGDTKTIKYNGEFADLIEEYINKNLYLLREEKLKRICGQK